jgi:hypothetical protein
MTDYREEMRLKKMVAAIEEGVRVEDLEFEGDD